MVLLHGDFPGLYHFIRIAGTDQQDAREGAQVGELLDWLMCRAILADSNRVMSEDMNDRQLHQRAETNSATRIVTKDEEPRSIGPHLDEAHPVQDGRHRVFADSKVEIASLVAAGLKITGALEGQPGLGGWSQVCRSTYEPGDSLCDRIQYLAGRVARSQTF